MIKNLFNSLWFRLLLGFAVPVVLFLTAALVAFLSINRLLVTLEQEQISKDSLIKAHQVKESLEAMAAAKRAHHLLGKDKFEELYYTHRGFFLEELILLKEKLGKELVQQSRLDQIEKLERKWHENAKVGFQLWKVRPKLVGMEWLEQLNLEEGVELSQQIRILTDDLIKEENSHLTHHLLDVQSKSRESIYAIVAALVISMGLSLVVAEMLSRSITKPVYHLRTAVNNMRQGRYEAVLTYGPTEIQELIRGFNLMGIALAERTTLLESSELRYRTVVGTTSNLLWTTNAKGENCEMANWCALTGQKAEEVCGDGWLNVVHPEDRQNFMNQWREVLEKKIYAENEVRIRRADGIFRYYTCRSVPIFDARGDVVEWVRICVDITERKEEEKLRREKEAAETANRTKSEFLAKMSHELRTPLNAIIGMSKMLRTQRFGSLNDKQQDYLADVTQAGEHLLLLINEILDLTKVEAGRMELKLEQVPAGANLQQIVSTVRALAESKKVTLRTIPPDPDGLITTDLGRFKQILFNLLSNAVKFTPPGGRVSVRAHWVEYPKPEAPMASRDKATAIRIDVEDTGIGISLEDQAKLGTEFFQARSSPHKAQEGTGLGLALSRRLVEMMGGTLWFTSQLGEGSTFSFALPLKPNQNFDFLPGPLKPSSEIEPYYATNQRVTLVIDDHVPTNKLLADWLEEAGLRAVSAYDGETGLQQAKRLKPELILLDIRMPGLNGFEVLSQLKSDPETSQIPVVIVSVLEGSPDMQELDVLDWFIKPLDKELLIQRIKENVSCLFSPEKNEKPVLVVDDNLEVRSRLKEMLSEAGLQAREAGSGVQALEMMKEETPSLVLLDLLMPRMDGLEVVQAIRDRAEWQHIPIILLTEKEMDSLELKSLKGSIQAIVRKDRFTRERFFDRIRSLGLIK